MNKFLKLTIGDIAYLGDGAHTKVQRYDKGILYLSAKNIKKGFIDYSEVDYISEKDFEKLFSETTNSIRDLKINDILFSIIGSVGNVYLYKKNDRFGISSSIAIIRVHNSYVEVKYLYWYLRSKFFSKLVQRVLSNSVQNYLNLPLIRTLPIYFPDKLSIQKKIVNILDNIDNKIELNNKINNELEDMAKTIYDYWFLQFEFPNEKGKPYKSSGGKMVWNEELKKEIPEGWEVRTLENLGNLIMGQSPKSTSYNNKKEGLPLINGAAELQKDKIEVTKYTSEPTRICKEKDLIFCIRATIGNINYADKSYCLGRGVGAFRVTEKEYVEYMFLTLRNILNMYNKILTGSIIVGITKEDLLQQNIVKPKNDVITQFYNKVHFMAEKMKSIKKENQELTALRDFLLPLLMNGQVGFKGDKAEG